MRRPNGLRSSRPSTSRNHPDAPTSRFVVAVDRTRSKTHLARVREGEEAMTYDYLCTSCGHTWEAEQRISEDPLKQCPSCSEASAKRQISGGAGFILKGGGWYSDLYSSAKPSGAESKGAESKGAETAKVKSTEAAPPCASGACGTSSCPATAPST